MLCIFHLGLLTFLVAKSCNEASLPLSADTIKPETELTNCDIYLFYMLT
jgi:hypothetical protein